MMQIVTETWVDSEADNANLESQFAPLPKRWPRFTPQEKSCWLAAGIALRKMADAGHAAPRERVGCVACGLSGSHATNRVYYADYFFGGRSLGRSALFIHTLPTAPAAECAVHFGLGGPLLYALPEDGRMGDVLELAGASLAQDGVDVMMALLHEGRHVCCLALAKGDGLSPDWRDLRLGQRKEND